MPTTTIPVPETTGQVHLDWDLVHQWDEHTPDNVVAAVDLAYEAHGHNIEAVADLVEDLLTPPELHYLLVTLGHGLGVPIVG